MSRSASSPPPQLKSRLGAILRSTSGNFLEQFDFFLFGFYAPYIAKAFFPSMTKPPRCSTPSASSGWEPDAPDRRIVLGSYIDRIGRRKGLIVTLAIMAIGTVTIAVCPTYASIGVAAPIIVLVGVCCRAFRRRRTWRCLGLSLRDRHTRQQGFLHLVPVRQPASRDLRRRDIGFALNEAVTGDTIAFLGGIEFAKWRIPFSSAASSFLSFSSFAKRWKRRRNSWR